MDREDFITSILAAVATLQGLDPAPEVTDATGQVEEMLSDIDQALWGTIEYIKYTHKFAAGDTSVVL